jgi:transposase-like protein
MTKIVKRYSATFKRQVVSEYEAGSEITSLKTKYGIGGDHTIEAWIRKYGKEGFRHELVYIQTTAEVGRIQVLEKQVMELQQALGRVTLEKLKLESMLEVLQGEEMVKKNARSSSRPYAPKSAASLEGQ